MSSNRINIDGIDYVRADSLATTSITGKPYVIVRSGQAGVFAGYLLCRENDIVELAEARRIFYWAGAATLSQLATEGTSKPSQCKFPVTVPTQTVLGVCEILPCSVKAQASIASVKIWSE